LVFVTNFKKKAVVRMGIVAVSSMMMLTEIAVVKIAAAGTVEVQAEIDFDRPDDHEANVL